MKIYNGRGPNSSFYGQLMARLLNGYTMDTLIAASMNVAINSNIYNFGISNIGNIYNISN